MELSEKCLVSVPAVIVTKSAPSPFRESIEHDRTLVDNRNAVADVIHKSREL